MESPSSSAPDPSAARAALEDAASARSRAADRIHSPWWYRTALGLSVAVAFVAVSAGEEFVTWGVLLGLGVGPLALTWALTRSTGVSIDRYLATSAARRVYLLYMLAFAGIGGVGLVFEFAVGLRWSMTIAGIAVFVLILFAEPRIDAAVRQDVRAGR